MGKPYDLQRDVDIYCLIDDYVKWYEILQGLDYRSLHPTIYGNGVSSVKWTPMDLRRRVDISRFTLDFHIILKGEHSVLDEYRYKITDIDEVADEIYNEILGFDFSCCMNMFFMNEIYSNYYELTKNNISYYFPECKGTSPERKQKYKDLGIEFREFGYNRIDR
jgi:hypothetical protein